MRWREFSFLFSRSSYVRPILRHLTLRKIANLARAGFSYVFRLKTSSAVPPLVTLMLTYRCNYSCIMCQKVSTEPNEYHDPQSMDFDELKRFIETYGDRITIVRLFGGEPLFYTHVAEVIDLLHRHNVAYSIGTNGALLTPPILEKIVGECAWVSISLDSADPDNYARIRAGGDLSTIKSNLTSIREFKRWRRTQYPVINANSTVFTYNIDDVEDLIRFCRSYGIESLSVSAGKLYGTPEVTDEHLIQHDRERSRQAIDRARSLAEGLGFNLRVRMRSLYMAPRTEATKAKHARQRNAGLYFEMTIQPDFNAVASGLGYRSMGRINGSGLDEVWNGRDSLYQRLRSGLTEPVK